MKFEVWRASDYGDDTRPCEVAKKECITVTDKRIFESTNELSKAGLEEWNRGGLNHRIIDGKIARDINKWTWTIEIDTLAELIEFIKTNGEIIMAENTIAIHDDYL